MLLVGWRQLIVFNCRPDTVQPFSQTLTEHTMTRLEAISRLPATEGHTAPARGLSIGQYLIRRLQDYGLKHVFGIPGDYVLTFYGQLEKSPIQVIGCTREDSAGFAADAYARIN